MTKNANILLLVALLLSVVAFSQEDDHQGRYPPDYDTNYIEDFRHRLNISLVSEAKANVIGFITPDNKLLTYQTNLPVPNYGLMVSYRWLNGSLTVPIPGISYTRPDRGETKSIALSLGFTGRKWYLRNFFEYFKGYYLPVTEPIPGIPESTKFIVNPDMESTTYYASAYYGFNGEKYSHRSLLWQSEIQKKSAGSFLVGATAGFKLINSPIDLLPGDFDQEDINAASYYFIGLNIGYAYTLVIGKHFNTSLALIPGANYTRGSYNSNQAEGQVFQNTLGVNAEGRFQLLYEHEFYYVGVSYTLYLLTDFVQQDYPVGSAHNYLKFNIGYRFKIKPIKFLDPLGLSN